jgi:ribosomal protein S18 acetylase RimI-like enzyme
MLGDEELIEALEIAAWTMYRRFGLGPGARLTDTPTRLLYETPVPQPPYNMVFRFLDDGTCGLQDQVDDVLAVYEGRPVTLAWLVHPSSPPEVRSCLGARGLVMAEELYGMAADLSSLELAVDLPVGVEIVEASAANSAEWMEILDGRYGLDANSSTFVRAVVEAYIGETCGWIAKVDGVPASKVVLQVVDGVAGIFGVATSEHGRGKGLARSLTKHALRAAQESGCEVGVLHSTPMAHELYRSIGFRDVVTFEIWAEPDRVHL